MGKLSDRDKLTNVELEINAIIDTVKERMKYDTIDLSDVCKMLESLSEYTELLIADKWPKYKNDHYIRIDNDA